MGDLTGAGMQGLAVMYSNLRGKIAKFHNSLGERKLIPAHPLHPCTFVCSNIRPVEYRTLFDKIGSTNVADDLISRHNEFGYA
jgi:hypothetical protein